MAQKAVIWVIFLIIVTSTSGQILGSSPFKNNGICKTVTARYTPKSLRKELQHCVVILGNLQIAAMEQTKKKDFANISFPKLREVTGYMVVYRVRGLNTLGQLFPNLARIRGRQLFYNYGLIVADMANLTEIGLFSLLKIDRGGVIAMNLPEVCYVDTIDWKAIAPRARHVIHQPVRYAYCTMPCTCSLSIYENHCWNNRKCQRFVIGAVAEKCNSQCLGCRKTNPNECSVCRYFTHRGKCVSRCPNGTIVLPDNQYCITEEECRNLDRWAWNQTCVFECPIDYVTTKNHSNGKINVTCVHCPTCQETCDSQIITTVAGIQEAERCVFINGSLTIHVRAVAEAMQELRMFLNRIQEVSEYVVIYGSVAITSLDFLPSLCRIKGDKLVNHRYSLVIHDMVNLRTLFNTNVTKALKIDHGTLRVYDNPALCSILVDEVKKLFPMKPDRVDIPPGSNGYDGGCKEVTVNFHISVMNETAAIITFSPLAKKDIHYTILYMRYPPGGNTTTVLESCSKSDWHTFNLLPNQSRNGILYLTSLHPATTYAVCIETYGSEDEKLGRSNILSFTTAIGVPEPPFLVELAADLPDVVVLRWVDHKDYHPHITGYELDVFLIDYHANIATIDYCRIEDDLMEIDISRHAVVMRPPPEYHRSCESMCGVLSSFHPGALVEEYFDVCNDTAFDCNEQEDLPPDNSTFDNYIQTLSLNLSGPRNDFQVGGLAPFRDYRFRLRACTKNQCSRSAKGVVRTRQSPEADVPNLMFGFADAAGHVSIKWEPPYVTNGLVLSYSIEVLPMLQTSTLAHLLPQAWCVPSYVTDFVVKSEAAAKYKVRVCAKTLASVSACSSWLTVEVAKTRSMSHWWSGVIFGILLCITSTVLGSLWKTRRDLYDTVSLINNLMTPEETEPPSFMLS